MIFALTVGTLFVAGIIWLAVSSYRYEKKQWNGGVCERSGKKWRHFDTASDGSMGFTDGVGNYIWISHHRILGND